ncbi:MAG: hypothetical protein E7048_07065 [Lentisphaerae bacterium]|nr:hypothetical protein [Lentisphaerota bacterium]MBR2873777.1 hypothetical protein [Lentisphaeria bacterium]
MQVFLRYFCVTALLFSGVALCGNSMRRPMFTSVKVGFRMLQPPRFKAGSVSSVSRGSLNLHNRRWGVVEIAFTPRYDFETRSKGKSTLTGVWLDDVSCGVQLVALESGKKNAVPVALFSTKVDFWTIQTDGKEHRYFVYLPPVLLDRVMPPRRTDSRNIRVADAADFIASVVFFHKKWGVLGEGYYGLKGRLADRDFRELVRKVPGNSIFHGALLSRARSPWGMSDVDEFDLEKPAFIPAPLDENAIAKAAEAAAAGEQSASDLGRSSKSGNSKKNKKSRR